MAMAGDVLRRGFPEEELHVLAVDDSLVDRKVIEKLLKRLSCKVTAVDSAMRALQLLGLMDDGGEDRKCRSSDGFVDDEMKINLIMTDYSMPGMTGYELLKKIKESAALREIPVVIMSSERFLPRINRCLEEGAEEFLSKPVRFADVKRLRDFVMRSGEISCNPATSAMKSRRPEEGGDALPRGDSFCSFLPSEHEPSKYASGVSIPSPSRVAVAVISPKRRMKVRSRDQMNGYFSFLPDHMTDSLTVDN